MDGTKCVQAFRPLMGEVGVRIVLWACFLFMETRSPFVRVILPEETWMYMYPHTGYQYVPASYLWTVAIVVPVFVLTTDYIQTRNRAYYRSGMLCLSLLLALNGLVTVCIKLTVGRPRPDFFYRCFPDGNSSGKVSNGRWECTGDHQLVFDGRKSFPSGHASFSFASMLFLSLYFVHRLQVFDKCRGEAWRLIAAIAPLLLATIIAISRTCDYHHHWQDIVCGSLIGSMLAYVCYHQYFPPAVQLRTENAHATGGSTS